MVGDAGERIAIVTVHGTGDTATGPDGPKWFQRGSVFAERLTTRLVGHGVTADVIPHLWSGANSAKGREQGAEKLAKVLKKAAKDYDGVHVLGHSHGGNVANDAATMISWRRTKKKQKIDSITTVGTPFFKAELSLSESLGGVIFLIVSVFSVLLILLFAIALIGMMFQAQGADANVHEVVKTLEDSGRAFTDQEVAEMVAARAAEQKSTLESARIFLPIMAIGSIPLFFIFPIALQGLRRIMRLRAKKRGDAALFSIWHPNDEAIAFLQRMERLPISPFPKGSLWRGSRTSGIVWGVRAIIAVVLIGLGMTILGWAGVQAPAGWSFWDETTMVGMGGWIMFAGLLGGPLIFTVAYALARLFGGLLPEWTLRGYLNGAIGGIVKGMAFGQDGDERIGNVSTTSHTYGVHEHIVDGEVAKRMQAASSESAGKLIERYRWSLFTVGPDTNASMDELAKDTMTWDSLIHTTYFDQPEIADLIGDYIAAEAKKAAAG